MKHEIIQGDCLQVMKGMKDNSIDFIVTDPPYGLKFMGKDWDHGIPGVPFWEQALRVCKPGSHMLAFGGTRTFHRLAYAIEDAGWEIRDCLSWLYASGFPKSHNHFGIEGYGTALKPAWEPIILSMKPLDGTFAHNAEKWGIAGLNIDACKIGNDDIKTCGGQKFSNLYGKFNKSNESFHQGRWPANLILDEEAAEMLDQQSGISKSNLGNKRTEMQGKTYNLGFKPMPNLEFGYNDSGGASRFFYCAKASSSERNAGLNERCNHPTVKPLSLMRYLITLLAPPGNPILLDPFAGSGSTICAAKQLGIRAIGIEKEEEYCEIARRRAEHFQFLPEQYEMNL